MFLPSALIFWLRRPEENSKDGRESLKSRRLSSSLQLNKLKKVLPFDQSGSAYYV